ncbi:MAG: hypothetical protein GXP42_17525 [Chloroflexi bacterium]|nr:hypothetical protein [Chloroflexota bacterium]
MRKTRYYVNTVEFGRWLEVRRTSEVRRTCIAATTVFHEGLRASKGVIYNDVQIMDHAAANEFATRWRNRLRPL